MVFRIVTNSRTGQLLNPTVGRVDTTCSGRTLGRIVQVVSHACWSMLVLGGFTLVAIVMGSIFGQADASAAPATSPLPAAAPAPPGSPAPPSTPGAVGTPATGTAGTPTGAPKGPPSTPGAVGTPATGTAGTPTAAPKGTPGAVGTPATGTAGTPTAAPKGTPGAVGTPATGTAGTPTAAPPSTPGAVGTPATGTKGLPNATGTPGTAEVPAFRAVGMAGGAPTGEAVGRGSGLSSTDSAAVAPAPAGSGVGTALMVGPLRVASGSSPVDNSTVPVRPSPFAPAGPALSSVSMSAGGVSSSSDGGPGVGLATFSVLMGLGLALLFIGVCADDFRRLTSSFYLVPLARPG